MKTLKISFINWFIGFSEGDGSFIVPTFGSKRFEIWQSQKDAQVLYYIKKELGFGKVIFPKYRPNMALYLVNKTDQLDVIKKIFENKICTINTLTKYNLFFNTSLTTLYKPTWEDEWLSGFIDAEGCFRIKFEKNNVIKLIFEITQKDSQLILNIRDLFPSLIHNIRNDRGITRLAFSGKKPREKLIKYLSQNELKSHKRIILKKWMKADGILNNKHLYKETKIDWKTKILKLSKDRPLPQGAIIEGIKDRVRSLLRNKVFYFSVIITALIVY